MNDLAKQAGLELSWEGWTSPTPDNKYPECVTEEALQRFYELAVAEERKKYDSLLTEYEALANRAIFNNDFKNRLAEAIEQMPFGDTAASFAKFVRDFK